MDILIEPDCYKVCRICMESCEDDFVCVYDEFEDNILMDVIAECARVEIRKDDALPRNACRNCAEYMIIAYHIIQKCRDSDQTLRSIFKHEIDLSSRKEEPIFGVTDIHETDINPAEYAFLLSDAYDKIMLEDVKGLIAADANNGLVNEFHCEDHYQSMLNEDHIITTHSSQEIPTPVETLQLDYSELAGTEENRHPELSQHEAHATKKCCGCKKIFENEFDLKNHCDSVHLSESSNAHDDTRPFKCPVCYKSFSNQQLLKEHQRSVIRKYFCRQCGKGFMTQANLENHLKCHVSSRETRRCCGCRKDFKNDTELALHSNEVHKPEQTFDPIKPFECNICYRRYPTRKSLVSHKRMIQQHQCSHCGEFFMKKLFLSLHEKSCHPNEQKDDKKKRCCGCRLEFPNQHSLIEHAIATHINTNPVPVDPTKPFECKICTRRFPSKLTLRKHQRKISQEKRYSCEICGRSFNRAHDKATHETTHSNEMPYTCHICSRRFKNKLYLKNHFKLHATSDSRNFSCHECGKCFRTKDLLKTHAISHSEERKYACQFCSATFKRAQCLKIHTKVHTREKAFACTVCSKRYVQSSDLKRHMLTHNPGEGGKPFQCEYCLKRYPRKDYLKVHIRKQHLEKADMILIEEVALEFQGNSDGSDFLLI
ncbi:gastrula zinc finger protein XlCGF26.1-like [Topomyia yanbarensis]|uniref:gastrula zinc finger protein XlCGF26.1-like n=1 Tax=Topomyia yanbarensis TaxID=2498891 RepID=UPI00273B8344|nr:gastrula zinc finger protein XlCGF26.1-like [Topomyia yanbarensis]XP_058840338.1 gastrula zinc finger protein XlCGF26.1-like [Topomyia yanbarensis]XP_058840339.1 gastrula zinc finger protein XlCGF26.1-like [Topomyia yanbarensis]XP_058840340.1 gastrula zinc finger protein XlCGF26.1-like [Topomyia yanbarensis]XP_058840581.1 gastrula zinc finger protein XlCGF26.1-like [Topomyia yanbarensis]XP_058840582.1 gastrula zinc finger protein XlCGF26.1-like [Topomyia yanbarensis]XP_058840583.1 gastrula